VKPVYLQVGLAFGLIVLTFSILAFGYLARELIDLGWPEDEPNRWVAVQAWAAGVATLVAVMSTGFSLLLISQSRAEFRLTARAHNLAHDPVLFVEICDFSECPADAVVHYEAALARLGLAPPAKGVPGPIYGVKLTNMQTNPIGFAGLAAANLRVSAVGDAIPVRFRVGGEPLFAKESRTFLIGSAENLIVGLCIDVESVALRAETGASRSQLKALGTVRLSVVAGDPPKTLRIPGPLHIERDK
jgi:hypothetical protein